MNPSKVKTFFQTRQKSLSFIYFILGFIVFMSLFQISGSSIGNWNKLIDGDIYGGGLLLGIPRSIRSDEWLVQTPLAISQKENNFAQENQFIGNGEDTAVIYDAPNTHWSTIFKPHNWSFFIMPTENAFAFKWWFRGGLLIISTYLLLLELTKRNYFLSISGSLILFFSPIIQWWYSIQVMEPLAYGFLGLYFALRILKYENTKRLLLYSFGLFYSAIAFSLSFYPAYQIPVLYVVLGIFVGYILENREEIKKKVWTKFGVILTSIILALSVLVLYYFSVKDTISAILNSSYPGARFVSGGHFSLIHFLSGPYSFLLELNSTAVPVFFGNQSEAANYLILVPFLILLPYLIYKILIQIKSIRKISFIQIALILIFLLQTLFIFVGFPNFLAKITLFYLIPENRMMFGIGLIALFSIIIFLSRQDLNIKFKWKETNPIALSFSCIAFIFTFVIGRELYKLAPQYIRNYFIIIFISTIISIFVYLIFLHKRKLAILLFLVFSIFSAGFVNPLYQGLSPLNNSNFGNELKDVNRSENPGNKKWIVYDSMFWGNYLAAQGIPTINGTHLYPQLKLWEKYDNGGKYLSNYNRYSHIIFEESNTDDVSFRNPTNDSLTVKVNPCNLFIKELNVNLVLSENNLSVYTCLIKIRQVKNLNIYKLK